MGDSANNDVDMDLDLNQVPVEQPVVAVSRYGALIDELETAQSRIYERIRQLEAVTGRARQRERWRQTQTFVGSGNITVESTSNIDVQGGENSRVDNLSVTERNDERQKGYKRDSSHLVAKALEMDSEVKKVDKEGGSFFDCNICLEMAVDPILTCCGHLYCWVCFYTLPYVDSTAKECPACRGEVSDTNITPIYVNGNSTHVPKSESIFKVPPRPKAQRVESVRQQRLTRGLSIPVSEALRRIRTSIGTIGDHLREMPRRETLNHDTAPQILEIAQTTDNLRQQSQQFSRVLSENAASLSTISSALDNAERLVEDLETYIGDRLLQRRRVHLLSTDDRDFFTRNTAVEQPEHQTPDPAGIASSSRTNDVSEAALQLENLTTSTSPQTNQPELPSSSSLTSRVSDADRGRFRQTRRRRLT